MTTSREALLALRNARECWCDRVLGQSHTDECLMARDAIAAEELCECGKRICWGGPLLVTPALIVSDKCDLHPGIPYKVLHWRCGTPKGERCEKAPNERIKAEDLRAHDEETDYLRGDG